MFSIGLCLERRSKLFRTVEFIHDKLQLINHNYKCCSSCVRGHQCSSFPSALIRLTRCTYLQQFHIKGSVVWTFKTLILLLHNFYYESNQNNVFMFEIFCIKYPRICFVVLQLPAVTVCAVSIFVTSLWSVAVIWWILSLRLISLPATCQIRPHTGHVCFKVSRHAAVIMIESRSAWTCSTPAY